MTRRKGVRPTASASSRTERRIVEERTNPGDVRVSFQCPICGQARSRDEHDAIGMRGLDDSGLWQLRRTVSDGLVQAVRADAGHDTVEPMLALLDGTDQRLDQLAEQPMATVQQRQRIAARPTGRNAHSAAGECSRSPSATTTPSKS